MAAYPSIDKTTKVRVINEVRTDISDAGTPRFIDLSESDVVEVTVEHPGISGADRDTILAFYVANKTSTAVSLTPSDGVAYTALSFKNRPAVENSKKYGPLKYDVTSTLVGS